LENGIKKIEINIGMTSREKILLAVNTNQPKILPLINLDHFLNNNYEDPISKFISIAEGIGSKVFKTNTYEDIIKHLSLAFKVEEIRVVSTLPEFSAIAMPFTGLDNHQLADVELMILPAHFAVAENGACWVSDELFRERVLPFIPQHLVIVVNKNNIISTMHQAYQLIGDSHYGFGTFIAGPSKTADIEQSLVLGAHGARSLNVFFV
jgi:L-lactate dehydrogenase complex protein LldG